MAPSLKWWYQIVKFQELLLTGVNTPQKRAYPGQQVSNEPGQRPHRKRRAPIGAWGQILNPWANGQDAPKGEVEPGEP